MRQKKFDDKLIFLEDKYELEKQYELLRIQISFNGRNNPRTASIYNSIGRTHIRCGDYKAALYCFSISKDIAEKLYGKISKNMVACYEMLAGVYFLLEDFIMVDRMRDEEIQILEELCSGQYVEIEEVKKIRCFFEECKRNIAAGQQNYNVYQNVII